MARSAAGNLDRLATELRKAQTRMSDLDPAAAQVGALLVEVAKRHAPARTGRLRGAVRFSVRKSKQTRGGVRSAVFAGASTPYAMPIHYGWPAHNIRPNKFLTISLDKLDRSGKAVEIYTAAITDALNRL